ncbi:hypothetical protein ABL78_3489 [Leptomonas seymouri]|uniref:RRM domain-containing protein n=1 Tax=Leptomonas seymouri TaxID=5684 RepID=A0A0N1I4N7_LEPSE|nr:hypothetical protein ABL78_3489 [Leptomonas seymouri]|eukprot:KPI87405.1 hypothetical protein ABL78_3489 [Leptomonas seymouri]
MDDPKDVASSVFFTGVSLVIEPDKLRQHFESVGHVVSFNTYGPAPGKDFRYGIAGYMDPQTAEEAIRRLNGTTFGERAMRVTAARSTTLHAPARAGPGGGGSGPVGRPPFRKREREGYVPEQQLHYQQNGGPPYHQQNHSSAPQLPFYGRGRGRGAGGPPGRAPMMPRPPVLSPQPSTDKDGRELMQLPRGFIDPILGRDGSLVLNSLRAMATEEAYAAVEQLRVLALERPSEAQLLLQNNPALKSAVVITLQHAGRLAHGPLPSEAYRATKAAEQDVEKKTEEQRVMATSTSSGIGSGNNEGDLKPSPGPTATGASAPTALPAAKAIPAAPKSVPMTEQERDEVLELIQNMSEEDVDRVLTMTSRDLAQVPDVAQRKQLEILQRRLIEMSRDL